MNMIWHLLAVVGIPQSKRKSPESCDISSIMRRHSWGCFTKATNTSCRHRIVYVLHEKGKTNDRRLNKKQWRFLEREQQKDSMRVQQASRSMTEVCRTYCVASTSHPSLSAFVAKSWLVPLGFNKTIVYVHYSINVVNCNFNLLTRIVKESFLFLWVRPVALSNIQ